MTETTLTWIAGGIGAALAVAAWLFRARRVPLGVAALAAAAAAGAASADAFWPFAVSSTLVVWGLLAATDLVDASWRARAGLVLSVTLLSFVALWPSLATMSGGKVPCPEWVSKRVGSRLVAGLDLRGGMRLVYTVEVEEAIKDKRDHYYEDMRVALAKAFGLHSGDERPPESVYVALREKLTMEAPRRPSNVIRLEFKDAADVAKIDARFRDEFRGDMGDPEITGGRVTYRMRQTSESAIREKAVAQAKEIILRRIDELGLREASVSTRDEDIIVEVPGQDEASFNQIREIIGQTARLEFKLLDDDTDYMAQVERQSMSGAGASASPAGLAFMKETAPIGIDPTTNEQASKVISYAYLKLQPGEAAKDGLARFREWAATLTPPPDREIGFELVRTSDPATLKETDDGWRTFLLRSRAEITGDMVRDATAQPDQNRGSLGGWLVALAFTDQGGRIFERITGANVKRRFAIMLDNRVESTPVILSTIAGGHATITMGSSDPEVQLRDARKLELVLRSGALPAPISPNNEQRIGPTLGADAVQRAVQSALIGSLFVLVFMLVYYQRSGLIADVVVILNLLIQMAILASFGASITLPGIAGLALTIGMAVDSNVLINERLRDETRAGKKPRSAVEIGFERALSAIVDGNVTTIIAGVILLQYGTGPIRGFAVALIIGIAVNLFTGVVVSRVLFDYWVGGLRAKRLDVG
ncbi:MAG: protein translocase subunit SecD [Polyangiaceae bacterium]|nr:protein translocase subunit SecD [Polyangiaceae bacterium]